MNIRQYTLAMLFFAALLMLSACSSSDSGNASITDDSTLNDTTTDETSEEEESETNDNSEEEESDISDQIDSSAEGNPPTGFDQLWGIDSDGTGEQVVVFWPRPVRAHPSIPFEYGIVAYDKENDSINYALSNAPEGMTIDTLGIIRWQPNVESGDIEFDVLVDDGRNDPVTIPVTLTIAADNFFFVSTAGSSDASGSLADPFDSVTEGMRALRDKGYGTLIIRAGTYITSLNSNDDWNNVAASAVEPFEVMAYPGEHAIIDYNNASGGFLFYQSRYIYIRNLEFAKASLGESGGLVVISDHMVMTRVTIRDNDWEGFNNVSGFYLAGHEVVAHRCRGVDNYDRQERHTHNSVNYNFYADKNTPLGNHSVYVLHSYSEGSQQGYRIKHAGPGTVHLHGSVAVGSSVRGWGGYDDGTTVRFNLFIDNPSGMVLTTDPEENHGQDNMEVSYNTVSGFTETALELGNIFGRDGDNRFHNNVFTTEETLGSFGASTTMVDLWRFGDPNAVDSNDVSSDYNCFFAANDDAGFHLAPDSYGWDEWRGLGLDSNSVWADPELDPDSFVLSETSGCRIEGQRMGARN